MRNLLKIAYISFIFLIFWVFHLFCLKGEIPYAFVNLPLLVLAFFGYIYSKRSSRLLFIISWLVLYPVSIYIYKIGIITPFLPIAVFNLLLFGFVKFKNMVDETVLKFGSQLEEKEAVERKMRGEFKRLSETDTAIKEKESSIVNLYEITKKMSESLRFDEIFKVITAFVKENFEFRKAELLILKGTGSDAAVDKIYSVWKKEGYGEKKLETDYDRIVKSLCKDKKPLYLRRQDDGALLDELRIGDSIETFIAVPLLSENKIVGIITIENISDAGVERFMILSYQLALEMKKVLLYETIEELAIADSLTGLYVRRYFFERFREELSRSKRYKFKSAFMMVDIDDFKRCNDTYGHLVGDVILRETSRIMKENIREIDLIGRYGGEEFSLVLPETGRDGAMLVAERLRCKIAENVFRAYDEKLKITISIGVSVYPDDATDANSVIEKADSALYKAKDSGKNIVCAYTK